MSARLLLVVLLGITLPAQSCVGAAAPEAAPYPTAAVGLFLNQQLIEGVTVETDLDDPWETFTWVIERLPRQIVVYPSENYYYFELVAAGRRLQGSLNFYAREIDLGEFEFYYSEVRPHPIPYIAPVEGWLRIRAGDQRAHLAKIHDWLYSLEVGDQQIWVRLFEMPQHLPRVAQLTADEEFVASTMDESGVSFHLVYSEPCNHLYWIRNEDRAALEPLTEYASRLSIGARTGFAYYDDHRLDRRILIGVRESNVVHNTWYDGPFDQLPDNHIKRGDVRLKEYLLRVDPLLANQIDDYGHFLAEEDARVAIATYRAYRHEAELIHRIDEAVRSASTQPFLCRLLDLVVSEAALHPSGSTARSAR